MSYTLITLRKSTWVHRYSSIRWSCYAWEAIFTCKYTEWICLRIPNFMDSWKIPTSPQVPFICLVICDLILSKTWIRENFVNFWKFSLMIVQQISYLTTNWIWNGLNDEVFKKKKRLKWFILKYRLKLFRQHYSKATKT